MGRDFGALASPGIRGLASYDPGHDIVALRNRAGDQGLLELGGNESAWGPACWRRRPCVPNCRPWSCIPTRAAAC